MATKNKPKSSTLSISESSELREFRKTNEAIGLRVVEGSLSLLSRKVFNVMIFHAQEMKEPGLNSPINTPASKKYFWIPLSVLARDAAYDSKDTKTLKELLEGLQDIKLLMENERQWTSERLVSSVTLVNPEGFHKNSGQVWFGYAFPPEAHEQLMAPSTYTRLSIVYQSSFKSGASLGLYEICRRYATNPSKMTFIQTVEHWAGVITGNPQPLDNSLIYKYFKRDVLKPAMAEINSITDINVELIEHKNGRRVEKLQFHVELVNQAQQKFPAPPVIHIDEELLQRIMVFGFNNENACDFFAQHSNDLIRSAISAVEARAVAKGISPLTSTAAYFRWQIKELAKNPPPLAPALPAPKTTPKKFSGSTVMEKFLAHRAQEALVFYKDVDEEERQSIFNAFKKANVTKTVKLDRGIENSMVRSLFSLWYAKELWGEPSAVALSEYIERNAVAS